MAMNWFRRRDDLIDTLIKPVKQLHVGHDESLQAKASARREIAERIRGRANLVSSGSSSGSLLKMARKA